MLMLTFRNKHINARHGTYDNHSLDIKLIQSSAPFKTAQLPFQLIHVHQITNKNQ